MSSINHRNPKAKPAQSFAPLNTRRTDQTVGQAYGERREKTKGADGQNESWLQRAKDKFLGTKKQPPIETFANKNDQFLGAQKSHYSSNPIVERNRRTEEGTANRAKTAQPKGDHYVRFLDSVIGYLDTSKKKI